MEEKEKEIQKFASFALHLVYEKLMSSRFLSFLPNNVWICGLLVKL